LTIERTRFSPDPAFAKALVAFAEAVIAAELRRRLETTKGLFALLRTYEQRYHDAVRRNGRMTFADVERLLRPDAGGPLLASGEERLRGRSRRASAGDRLAAGCAVRSLASRRVSSAGHGQWLVLRNLIDEAVQDPEGARSFFYVGDVKQAIYAWREGDSRLFREILQRCNQTNRKTIEEQELNASWRSGPAVIAAVNRVFGARAALGQVVSDAAADAWAREWRGARQRGPTLAASSRCAGWTTRKDDLRRPCGSCRDGGAGPRPDGGGPRGEERHRHGAGGLPAPPRPASGGGGE
jgi:ATP-dependent helicase/nuclease subunit A